MGGAWEEHGTRAGKVGRRAGSKSRRQWQGGKRHRDVRGVWEVEGVCVVGLYGLYVRSTVLFVSVCC